jgi:hypothetical protein
MTGRSAVFGLPSLPHFARMTRSQARRFSIGVGPLDVSCASNLLDVEWLSGKGKVVRLTE